MPTYEYRCPDCAREFEVFQRMSDKPEAPCPDCPATAERLISGGAGLLFKGSGFYITDYRSDDYRKRAREESPKADKPTGKKTADKKTDKTAEKKPAQKKPAAAAGGKD